MAARPTAATLGAVRPRSGGRLRTHAGRHVSATRLRVQKCVYGRPISANRADHQSGVLRPVSDGQLDHHGHGIRDTDDGQKAAVSPTDDRRPLGTRQSTDGH